MRAVRDLLLALTLLSPATALAETPEPTATDAVEPVAPARNAIPKHRLWYSNAIFARINALGLINRFKGGYRLRLMESDSVLFNDTYLTLGVSARMSPAFIRVGPALEFSPIAVWKVWANYEFVGYFGTFNQITGFDSPNANHSEQTIKTLGRHRGRLGGILTFGTVLQAKVGPIAVKSSLEFIRFDLPLDSGENYFYDGYWDRLAPNRGLMVINDLDVIAFIGKARVGVRWTYDDGFSEDADSLASQAHHRVGPLFAYEFHDRGPGARFDKPTLFAAAQWWAQHPYRTGAEQPAALPLIAIGIAFQGDLLGPKPPGR